MRHAPVPARASMALTHQARLGWSADALVWLAAGPRRMTRSSMKKDIQVICKRYASENKDRRSKSVPAARPAFQRLVRGGDQGMAHSDLRRVLPVRRGACYLQALPAIYSNK